MIKYIRRRFNIIFKKLSINYYFWIAYNKIAELFVKDFFKKRCLENLITVRDTLDTLGINYWLTDGTLLGCFRDKDFITGDVDVDLGVFIDDLNEETVSYLRKKNLFLLRVSGTPDCGLEYTFTRKGCNLDIFFFYKEKDYIWHAAWLYDKIIKFKYPHIKFKKIEFKGELFNAPENIEEYVTLKYGENWHTPVGKWDWACDPKNIFK